MKFHFQQTGKLVSKEQIVVSFGSFHLTGQEDFQLHITHGKDPEKHYLARKVIFGCLIYQFVTLRQNFCFDCVCFAA